MEIDKEIYNQTDNKVPKECIQYTYIAAVNIDSVMKIDKKNHQVYLEECKYEIKEKKMVKLIDAELGLDDSKDSDDLNSE